MNSQPASAQAVVIRVSTLMLQKLHKSITYQALNWRQ